MLYKIKNELILNLDRLHTTELGCITIKKNLSIDTNDVVEWCKEIIANPNSVIMKKGKNWYVNTADYIITVNSYSYTIITAHMNKKAR